MLPCRVSVTGLVTERSDPLNFAAFSRLDLVFDRSKQRYIPSQFYSTTSVFVQISGASISFTKDYSTPRARHPLSGLPIVRALSLAPDLPLPSAELQKPNRSILFGSVLYLSRCRERMFLQLNGDRLPLTFAGNPILSPAAYPDYPVRAASGAIDSQVQGLYGLNISDWVTSVIPSLYHARIYSLSTCIMY